MEGSNESKDQEYIRSSDRRSEARSRTLKIKYCANKTSC